MASRGYTSIVLFICMCLSSTVLCSNYIHEKSHTTVPADRNADASSLAHFAEFLRALYSSTSTLNENLDQEDMPNEIPVLLGEREQDHEGNSKIETTFPSSKIMIPMLHKRNTQFCGAHLVEALTLICDGFYQGYFGKRSWKGKNALQDGKLGDTSDSKTWPFITDQMAHQILSGEDAFHRDARGVHDECCVKGCSYKELSSYCGPRSGK